MTRRFEPGEQVAVRYIWYGRISHARPMTVVRDSDELVALYLAPGSACRAMGADKHSWNELLLAGEWDLLDAEWRHSRVLMLARPNRWSSIWGFFSPNGGEALAWYVNLEEPMRRSGAGFDTRDLQLDLVVMPDHTWAWKDEREFDEMRELGLIDGEEARAVREEGEAVIAEVERGDAWWLEWKDWAPDPSWPIPVLPEGWDRHLTTRQVAGR